MSAGGAFAGVLAAGQGTRFQAAGVRIPKALIAVGGKSLLLRTLAAFAEAGFERVAVVVNDDTAAAVRAHLSCVRAPVAVDLVVKTTASTLETFGVLLGLASATATDRFVFTTVDAVTASGELGQFARKAAAFPEPIVLGVAAAEPDDESPLRVEVDPSGRARLGTGPYATAGFYSGRTAQAEELARAARVRGAPSLRAFLSEAAALSVVRGIVLRRAVDVDTPADVALAERALASWQDARGEHG